MTTTPRKKLNAYRVRLSGELLCTAFIEVQAFDEESAKEIAEANYARANWDGADYSTPEGATVETIEVKKL